LPFFITPLYFWIYLWALHTIQHVRYCHDFYLKLAVAIFKFFERCFGKKN
jgi:hypothetical protein